MSEPRAVISSVERTSDAETYLITFKSGQTAQLQVDTLDNVLHADHGEQVLVRYDAYDYDLTGAENMRIDYICKKVTPEVLDQYTKIMHG